ncbi:putative transsulfuration enzyme family protein [Coemansia reversa NRRL 1564]|uniref:Putative transsulfuration enzyme family protein n=1 Tax=Coemansia reversa (strain ATCC 12441 / NRRL 1564) TaxID=763665 RepID=A0A2G5B6R1_COERN|nr:putative transsulfuration enzyme family protein [Coemansia reversa NRRL 1564]|eukprot:PIA14733.1 putative transsulfuration enzyme family protein [Coemansia reversa NRRL 1564]
MVELKNSLYNTAAPSTQSIHGDDHLHATSEVSTPISVSTTFAYNKKEITANNYGLDQRYIYSRSGTPILTKVEATLSTLSEGYAVIYGSGLTAAFSVLVEQRPKKIALGSGYFGIKNVIEQYQRLVPNVQVVGLDCSYNDVDIVWLESPINPTGEVRDISSYALRAHAAGALLVVDATLAPPPLSYPFRQGADIVVHSATKFLGGHSDLLAGVVVSRAPKSAESMRVARSVLGTGPGSLDAWLLLRSLRTLSVRVQNQSQTATRLVAFLESHRRLAVVSACHSPSVQELAIGRRITAVRHASLQLSTTHCSFIETQHPNGYAPVFSIRFATKDQALFVARHLQLHTFATSLGSVESLVDWRHGIDSKEDPGLLRISVGLENFDDLANDWSKTLLALDAHEKGSAKL